MACDGPGASCVEFAKLWSPYFPIRMPQPPRTPRSIDSDVLIPHMLHVFNHTIHFPWAAKDPRAVLRARMQVRACGFGTVCHGGYAARGHSWRWRIACFLHRRPECLLCVRVLGARRTAQGSIPCVCGPEEYLTHP